MRKRFKNKGFTLVELTVSIAIFVTFTAVALFNYPRFSNRVSLDLLTHNIALMIRQAQTFGLGVKSFGGLFPPYGVKFTPNSKTFTFFGDVCGPGGAADGVYNSALCTPSGEDKEYYELFTIPKGSNEIVALCTNEPNVNPLDPGASPGCGKTSLDITFRSPRPDARIIANGSGSLAVDAEIIVSNGGGEAKVIVVGKTGQISIK